MILTEEVEVGISTSNIRHYSKIFENLHVGDIEFLEFSNEGFIIVNLDGGEIITKNN